MKKYTYEEYLQRVKNHKKSKYKNKLFYADGYIFDSTLEGKRYLQLKQLEKSGIIEFLELQPVFILQDSFYMQINDKKKCIIQLTYKADFQYIENGKLIIEDTKGHETNEYKLKRRLFLMMGDFDIFREYKNSRNIINYEKIV